MNLFDKLNLAIFTDGGSRGNPGKSASGVLIYKVKDSFGSWESLENLELIYSESKYLGQNTNNVAEWTGLLMALEYLSKNHSEDNCHIFMDSQLVMFQMLNKWKVKQDHLKPLKSQADKFAKNIKILNYTHVYGHGTCEPNNQVDKLVNQCLDNKPLF
jgi:ribonuclease HI